MAAPVESFKTLGSHTNVNCTPLTLDKLVIDKQTYKVIYSHKTNKGSGTIFMMFQRMQDGQKQFTLQASANSWRKKHRRKLG